MIWQISRLCRFLHRHQLPNPCSARSDTYGVLEGVCTGKAINDRQSCQPKECKPLHFEKRVKLLNNERMRWKEKGCTIKKEKPLCYITLSGCKTLQYSEKRQRACPSQLPWRRRIKVLVMHTKPSLALPQNRTAGSQTESMVSSKDIKLGGGRVKRIWRDTKDQAHAICSL